MKRLLVLCTVAAGLVAVSYLGSFGYAPKTAAANLLAGICTPGCDPVVAHTATTDPEKTAVTFMSQGLPTIGNCTARSGRVIRHTIRLDGMDESYHVRVYQPPCYDMDAAAPGYPVLLLLHGQSFNEDQWERLGVAKMADQLILNGEAPPFLIVMPREISYLADPKESAYGDELVSVVLPWVDENYNTCTMRECRAIGGISRGAAWAMREGLKEWQTFGAIGAHSLPPFRGDVYSLPYWLAAFPAAERPRLFLDIGIEDRYYEAAGVFEAALTEKRVPHEWHLNHGGHDEAYWGAHVEEYLRWYTAGWLE